MYLEPVLLKNQGITTNQRINKQVMVNPNYDPNDTYYEPINTESKPTELPITDSEYELANGVESTYDFATAIENKNS